MTCLEVRCGKGASNRSRRPRTVLKTAAERSGIDAGIVVRTTRRLLPHSAGAHNFSRTIIGLLCQRAVYRKARALALLYVYQRRPVAGYREKKSRRVRLSLRGGKNCEWRALNKRVKSVRSIKSRNTRVLLLIFLVRRARTSEFTSQKNRTNDD